MSGAYSTHSIHQEAVVEDHIVSRLVAAQGYKERPPDAYDKSLAIDRELVLRPRAVRATGGLDAARGALCR